MDRMEERRIGLCFLAVLEEAGLDPSIPSDLEAMGSLASDFSFCWQTARGEDSVRVKGAIFPRLFERISRHLPPPLRENIPPPPIHPIPHRRHDDSA